MKTFYRIIVLAVSAALMLAACCRPEEKAVRQVIKRTFGACPSNVSFSYAGPSEGTDWYALEVSGGKLTVSGSSPVALCKGFHDYIQDNGYGSVTWSGSRLDLPRELPDMPRTQVTSPFSSHLFYNVCTFGYSTPYWGWKEWEKEIDWLALHGFDMPLAPVGTEGILYRVYEQMGLSDEEIQAYFAGPGHFPWMRMGNMCAQDGGMSRRWHEKQIALEHRILRQMRSLGMEPVFQGFAGFVPEAVANHFPEVSITRNDWHGLHNQLLSAKDSLFQVIGTSFIKEWEKEFGKGKYYLVDSFNEMDVPFGPRGSRERYETIKSYSYATYKSIQAANPDAVWVLQGWMFGRDRTLIWDPESVKALLDGAPDDKLLVVDLAVDFNEFVWRSEKDWDYLDGFSGKEWIWSTTPNFGGRTSLKGYYGFYLNAHLDALSSPNRGRLTGFGSSPEGIESNEALYEAISSAGWSSSPKDAKTFLSQYFASRYACEPALLEPFVEGLLGSVYNNFSNTDKHSWATRPGPFPPNVFNINRGFYDGIGYLLSLAGLHDAPLYRTDVITYAAAYLCAKADELYKDAMVSYALGDKDGGRALASRLYDVLLAADRLLESHPLMRMQRWLDYAGQCATSASERMEFRTEALRLVTTWDAEGIHDYASRCWSGLLRDYYVPRLKALFSSLEEGKALDIYAVENAFIEKVAREGFSPVTPYEDVVAAAAALVEEAGAYSPNPEWTDVVSCWTPYITSSKEGESVSWNLVANLSNSQVSSLKGFRFESASAGPLEVKGLKVGGRRRTYPAGADCKFSEGEGFYPYDKITADMPVEVWTPFSFSMESAPGVSGCIRLVEK